MLVIPIALSMLSPMSDADLDPWALPVTPLRAWQQLPSSAGVTFVIRKRAILHIGVAKDLNEQWMHHPLLDVFNSLSLDTQIHVFASPDCSLQVLFQMASRWIDTYSPQLNAVKPTIEAANSLGALEAIQNELQELEAQPYLLDCYLQRTAAGGTAAGKGRDPGRYACLRSRNQTFVNGKKSQYIPIYAIAKYEEQCERGRRIKRLRRSRDNVHDRLERARKVLKRTGIELPPIE
ncbi:MAG: hypothetical protein AAFY26_24185 [Cyanobacteria bacterium J06638_22]